ncbi:hypothetical protein BU14_2043s0001 [Porphyra umbilicalis]|uniref:Uncharacterized protein n=1 Tax=Porphyra umbilicalis TaxID=2786 RepID=A0A1X6NK33_PORUM|nr:hypothetical protein BU14_2043s0001 [Porphyra umbilicalis]|eukprot:OSX68958.1 hypothetical protein BU14_2043s0001 [Porphyra umbilicalis]
MRPRSPGDAGRPSMFITPSMASASASERALPGGSSTSPSAPSSSESVGESDSASASVPSNTMAGTSASHPEPPWTRPSEPPRGSPPPRAPASRPRPPLRPSPGAPPGAGRRLPSVGRGCAIHRVAGRELDAKVPRAASASAPGVTGEPHGPPRAARAASSTRSCTRNVADTIGRTSSTATRAVRYGMRSVSAVSSGSPTQVVIGTPLGTSHPNADGRLSTMSIRDRSRPRTPRSLTRPSPTGTHDSRQRRAVKSPPGSSRSTTTSAYARWAAVKRTNSYSGAMAARNACAPGRTRTYTFMVVGGGGGAATTATPRPPPVPTAAPLTAAPLPPTGTYTHVEEMGEPSAWNPRGGCNAECTSVSSRSNTSVGRWRPPATAAGGGSARGGAERDHGAGGGGNDAINVYASATCASVGGGAAAAPGTGAGAARGRPRRQTPPAPPVPPPPARTDRVTEVGAGRGGRLAAHAAVARRSVPAEMPVSGSSAPAGGECSPTTDAGKGGGCGATSGEAIMVRCGR